MNKSIEINYPNGKMIIHLERFFPTTSTRCKKLLKVIDLDWEHQDELKQSILEWMNVEMKECFELAKFYETQYLNVKPTIREAESKVKTLKLLKSLKQELKNAKREHKKLKENELSFHSSLKKCKSKIIMLQKNVKMFEI